MIALQKNEIKNRIKIKLKNKIIVGKLKRARMEEK